MLNAIASWVGYGTTEVPQIDDNISFVTKESDDWTFVDLDKQKEVSFHDGLLNHRENHLIEHPSMLFVKKEIKEPETPVESRPMRHKGAPTTLRRSQRRAARQASSVISQMNRTNSSKRATATYNNKSFQKMRQIVHQPRKHC